MDPRREVGVLAEQVEGQAVGAGDVGGVAGEGDPAERALPEAEERADVGRHEARDVERVRRAGLGGAAAQVVAVVEDDRAERLLGEHRVDVRAHAGERAPHVPLGVVLAQRARVGEREADGDVARQRVVGRRLVGDHVGDDPAALERAQQVDDVRADADRDRLALLARGDGGVDRLVEVVDAAVEVARGEPLLDAGGVDVGAEERGARHDGGERLGAAHPPEPPRDHEPAAEVAVELGAAAGGERLVGALDDPLGPDVDPRARRHLPVHDQVERLEAAELVPRGPVGDEQAVGEEDPGGVLVRAPDRDRPPRLDAQRLVGLHPRERREDGAHVGPGAGRAARPAVDHEVLRVLGDLGVEVVLEHPERGFQRPRGAVEVGAPGGPDRALVPRRPVLGRRGAGRARGGLRGGSRHGGRMVAAARGARIPGYSRSEAPCVDVPSPRASWLSDPGSARRGSRPTSRPPPPRPCRPRCRAPHRLPPRSG